MLTITQSHRPKHFVIVRCSKFNKRIRNQEEIGMDSSEKKLREIKLDHTMMRVESVNVLVFDLEYSVIVL